MQPEREPGPSSRQLKDEDFYGGLPRLLKAADKITISVELVDFDKKRGPTGDP